MAAVVSKQSTSNSNMVIMIDLEKASKTPGAVNQACKSPYHSEGESVEDDCSSHDDHRSNYTNTSVVKLSTHHHRDKNSQEGSNDPGDETSSMASGHSSGQGFSYILGANSRSRRSFHTKVGKNNKKFGGKHATRKKRMKESHSSQHARSS